MSIFKEIALFFDTDLDSDDDLVFSCSMSIDFSVENTDSKFKSIRGVSSHVCSANNYVRGVISAVRLMYPDVPLVVNMTTGFTPYYFDDFKF